MKNFSSKLSASQQAERLLPPQRRVKAVLDTDAYNEIDDQFAILYAMLSPEKIDLQAIYAALFYNGRSSSPADGMEKSYQEILKICGLTGRDPEGFVFRGCRAPLEVRSFPRKARR